MLIFDLETDGLLSDSTKIHCLVIYDSKVDKTYVYNDQGDTEPIVRGVTYLEEADRIAGHNIIGYDIPIIKKFYPFFKPEGEVIDTLLLSRLYYPNRLQIDEKQYKHLDLTMRGRHSLESYGYRLKEYKGQFSKRTDWKNWSQEMQDYCCQDVNVTKKLCDHFHHCLIGSS